MNKYQEALDRLLGITHNFPFKEWQKKDNKEMKDTLQELVDTFTIIKENYYKDKLKVSRVLHKLITEEELEILGEEIDWSNNE